MPQEGFEICNLTMRWSHVVMQCLNTISLYLHAGVMHFLVFLWIPSYYNENYGVDVRQSALLSILPWCCAIVATISAGALADALCTREVLPLTHVRKLMQGIGSFGPAGCLFYLAWLNKVTRLNQVVCSCSFFALVLATAD